jgi:hypothetical protein
LPSSFNTVRSHALVCSTSPPVSVSGTVFNAGAVSRKSPAALSIQSERTTYGLRHAPAGGGILTPFPSATAFALALGARLTLRGLTLRRNPWTFGVRVSHPHLRYSCQHSHFRCLHRRSRAGFTSLRNAPLPLRQIALAESAASVRGLSPVTFSAPDGLSRPVSYYAFFKGWLLLSQPPGCLGLPTSFPT